MTLEPLLPAEAIRTFYDGTLGDPQLDHPEGVAVAADGSVWCGGERGQIFRIEPDGSRLEQVEPIVLAPYVGDRHLLACPAAFQCRDAAENRERAGA